MLLLNTKSRAFARTVPLFFLRLATVVALLASVGIVHAASWTEAQLPTSESLRSVRRLQGRWFAVGDAGTLLVSADGLDWSKVNVGTTVNFTDVAWGRDKFVLVSTGSVYTHNQPSSLPARFLSPDGLAWTPVIADTAIAMWAFPFRDNSLSIDRIRFVRDRFVALAAPRMQSYNVGSPRTVLTSLDGQSWSTSQSVGLTRFQNKPIFDILADTSVTIVAGSDLLASSTDGVTWTQDNYATDPWHDPSPLQDQLRAEYGYRVLGRVGDSIVALGFNIRAESTDGVIWTKSVLSNGVVPLTFHRGIFFGQTADPGGTRLVHSIDGRVWTDAGQAPAAKVDSLTFTETEVVALSGNRIFRTTVADLRPAPRAKLLNLSFRGRVGVGDDLIIGGFVVGGDGPMRVLLRGVGPGLANYGVNNPLVNPKLMLFDAKGHVIGNNDTWSQGPDPFTLQDAASAVGAFPLIEGSNDAAMVVTLEPGIYTVHIVSMDGSSGVALGEIYEVP